jgi:hypothetical protein
MIQSRGAVMPAARMALAYWLSSDEAAGFGGAGRGAGFAAGGLGAAFGGRAGSAVPGGAVCAAGWSTGARGLLVAMVPAAMPPPRIAAARPTPVACAQRRRQIGVRVSVVVMINLLGLRRAA